MMSDISELLKRMRNQIADWECDEPREDWWGYQHDFVEAHDILSGIELARNNPED